MRLLSAAVHKMRLAGILVPAVLFTAAAAPAAMINGTFNINQQGDGPPYLGSSTSSLTSIDFSPSSTVENWLVSPTGDFGIGGVAATPKKTDMIMSDLTGITLDGATHADVIPDFIKLVNSNSATDMYEFDLATMQSSVVTGSSTVVSLFGTGTISDPADAFDPTPAQFRISLISLDGTTFSSYSGSFAAIAAVPEPASMTMLAVAGLALLRRRRA